MKQLSIKHLDLFLKRHRNVWLGRNCGVRILRKVWETAIYLRAMSINSPFVGVMRF